LADDAELAESRIRALLGDGAVGAWIGEAGEAFRDKTGDLPEQLGKCKASYRLASEALERWAGRLATHQADADDALVKGRVARRELEEARARASSAAAAATSAGNAGALRPVAGGAEPPSAEAVSAARDRLRSAQAASASADAAVGAAQARLDQLRQLALDARSLREADARTAAGQIGEASDAGIPERSRWEKFKDWAAQAWDVIVTIAKVVVAVLGVVALIIGGPIAWVVFAAALLVLADTIMKYLQGRASLWDVGFAALSCIPGTRGLTTLAALKTAFRTGGLLGAGLHVAASAKAAVVEMAQAVRALGGSLRTTLTSLGGRLRLGDVLAATRTMGAEPRIYSMWDGIEHATRFAPEQLASLRSARTVLADALEGTSWTMDDLVRAINRPTSDLSAADRTMVSDLRALVGTPGGDDVVQKVITPQQFDAYILGRDPANAGFDATTIGGSVTNAADTLHLSTVEGVFDGLRLDYPGTPFQDFGETVSVIRFQPDGGTFVIPQNADMAGTPTRFDSWSSPFTGNGFTGAHDVIPESYAQGVTMQTGAEMWELTTTGNQRLVAVLRGDEWIPAGS
jgi:hypothetical protein